jgi:glutamate racemase
MKIGIFDSGLGGLVLMRAIVKRLPLYDYIYLGDTKRVPYGNRSGATVYQYTEEAVDYLFHHGCQLVIVACNTASAEALRLIQRGYLRQHYHRRRVLGVVIPTAEVVAALEVVRVGVLATTRTVESEVYRREIKKLNAHAVVFEQAAPLLVPLAENDGLEWSKPIINKYIQPLMKKNISALVLGCTHYPLMKQTIRKLTGKNVTVLSQDEIVPAKLAAYLRQHPELERRLDQRHGRDFLVTEQTPTVRRLAARWFGKDIKLKTITIER